MGCETTPASCLEPSNIFAGIYQSECGGFADPSNFQAEKALFKSAYRELINNYGVNIEYYSNGFKLEQMNLIYGEHPTQEYLGPFTIKAYPELEEGVTLTQFGMEADDTLDLYISIDDFILRYTDYVQDSLSGTIVDANGTTVTTVNPARRDPLYYNTMRIEPKSDDLIELTALGCDRPGDRGAKIFQVTEVLDQSVGDGINPVMGHYVWKITLKRFEYSGETNAPVEEGDDQVYDNTYSGKLSSALFPSLSTPEKIYSADADTLSQQIYNMDNTDNNVYGDYY